jgi:hypothetical protein
VIVDGKINLGAEKFFENADERYFPAAKESCVCA